MTSKVVVLGSSNTDMIIRVERIPHAGETLLGGQFLTAAGGKGANQAVAAARAGGRVSLVARVGQDSLGDRALDGLTADGIDISRVYRDKKAASGAALIFVDKQGENSIAVASGANAKLSPADVQKARPVISNAEVLLLQLETPLNTVTTAARLGHAHKVRVILNPAPARALPDSLLRCVSILTPNESEAELLTGTKLRSASAAGKVAQTLRNRGVETVIITLGADGALIADQHGTRRVSGFRVKAIDTTGAGDTFNGALAVFLAEGRVIDEAVRMANAAAAISVTRIGAQPSAPTRREIEKLLNRRE
jgi:ribokinase